MACVDVQKKRRNKKRWEKRRHGMTNTSSSRRTKREWNPSRFRVKVNKAEKRTELRFVSNRFCENRSGFRFVHLRYKHNDAFCDDCARSRISVASYGAASINHWEPLFSMSFAKTRERGHNLSVSYLQSNVSYLQSNLYLDLYLNPSATASKRCANDMTWHCFGYQCVETR